MTAAEDQHLLDSLRAHGFQISDERRKRCWIISCRRCRCAWRVSKAALHVGNALRLLDHALSHAKNETNPGGSSTGGAK